MLVNKLSPECQSKSRTRFETLRARFYQQFWQYSADSIGAELQNLSDNWWVGKEEWRLHLFAG